MPLFNQRLYIFIWWICGGSWSSLALQCSECAIVAWSPEMGIIWLVSASGFIFSWWSMMSQMVWQFPCHLIIPQSLKGDNLSLSDRKSSLHELLSKIIKLLLEALQPWHVFQHYTQDVDNTNPLKVFAINVMPDFWNCHILLPDSLSPLHIFIHIEGIWMHGGVYDKGSSSTTFKGSLRCYWWLPALVILINIVIDDMERCFTL